MPTPLIKEHGGGTKGIRGCLCEVCAERRREYARLNARKYRAAKPRNPPGGARPGAGRKPVENPGYWGRHRRVYKARGSASGYACENCGWRAMQWARIHGRTGNDPADYRPLCGKCHAIYDAEIHAAAYARRKVRQPSP